MLARCTGMYDSDWHESLLRHVVQIKQFCRIINSIGTTAGFITPLIVAHYTQERVMLMIKIYYYVDKELSLETQ